VPVRPVLKMGNPLLRKVARDVSPSEIKSDWFKNLILDLTETMRSEDGVGIAAPQIGESVRVSIIEFGEDSDRYSDIGTQGLTIFVNPKITVLDEETEGFWEGCLSVPGLRGYVERARKVSVEYLDENAKPQKITAEEFLAIVVQHEFDHLDGILYVDRVKDKTKLSYIEEYREFILKDEDDYEV
jgi:peptide deformylase